MSFRNFDRVEDVRTRHILASHLWETVNEDAGIASSSSNISAKSSSSIITELVIKRPEMD
jgi:hypothetical protein